MEKSGCLVWIGCPTILLEMQEVEILQKENLQAA